MLQFLGNFELDKDPITRQPKMATGSLGRVYFATDATATPPQHLAIKEVRLAALSDSQLRQAKREPIILSAIRQKLAEVPDAANRQLLDKFVALHASHEVAASMYLVMERMDGDLFDWLVPTQGLMMRQLDEATVAGIIFEVLVGLAVLHHNNIAHRDIKLENVLYRKDPVTGNMTFKLTDFGLAKVITRGSDEDNTPCGTQMYIAPEVIAACRMRKLGPELQLDVKPTDMWSLGVMLYVMLIGKSITREALARRAAHKMLFDPSWCRRTVSDDAKDLVERLLDMDPTERDSVGDAGYHRFFARHGLDYGQVHTALDKDGGPIQGAAAVVLAPQTETFEMLPENCDPAVDLAGTNQEPCSG